MFVERSAQYTSFSSRKQPANAGTERKQFTENASVPLQQPILTHAHTKCPPVAVTYTNQLLCRKYLATFLLICGGDFRSRAGQRKGLVCRYRTNLGDFRHRRTLGIYKRTWKRAQIAKRNSTKCKWIFHQLAAKNFNVNVVQRSTASVIRYSIGKKKKSYIIHLFDRPKSGFVRAKKYLAAHHDRRPAVRYFEPCTDKQKMCDAILVNLLIMQAHYSQSSRENVTPSSSTSPLASYMDVPSPEFF